MRLHFSGVECSRALYLVLFPVVPTFFSFHESNLSGWCPIQVDMIREGKAPPTLQVINCPNYVYHLIDL